MSLIQLSFRNEIFKELEPLEKRPRRIMAYLPQAYSAIQLTKYRSYAELDKKLQIWLKSSEKGWGYEQHETTHHTILWAKSLTGTAKFIVINKNSQSFDRGDISLIAGILANVSFFRSTRFPLSLNAGWTNYFPRKFALNDFRDLITFLEEDPNDIVHHTMSLPFFLQKTLKGLVITNLIVIFVFLIVFGTYISFTLMNLSGIGLIATFLELGIITPLLFRAISHSVRYSKLDFERATNHDESIQ